MAGVSDLATELNIMLASFLDRRSLLSLSLVARQFRGTAQEGLHRNVELSPHYRERLDLFQLVSTSMQRPDLAQHVCTLPQSRWSVLLDLPQFWHDAVGAHVPS
jgi:hypothetical protein